MKTKSFSQLRSHVLMAACAALFAGTFSSCYKEAPADEAPLSGKWQISIPATMDQNPDTRAVVFQDGKLTAEFRTTDNIYVIKGSTIDNYALHPDADGPRANLIGSLEGTYAEGDELILAYMTAADGSVSFTDQIGGHVENGELNKFDYAVATVTVTSASDGDITTTPALFQSLQSMYKFTFVDKANENENEEVKVTKLLVSTKSGDLITTTNVFGTTVNKGSVAIDIANGVDATPSSVVWMALNKASNGADTFIFDVLDNENNAYMGTLDVKNGVIQNGKFYTATITLTKQENDPLTLKADEDGTITIKNPNGLVISYLKNLDTRVTSLTGDTNDITISVKKNDVVRFYGDNESYSVIEPDVKYTNIFCDADCDIYGNIMSLIDSDGYDTATLTGNYTFLKLFYENTHIKNHDSTPLTLPATTLTEGCYSCMFQGCKGLTTAPELPATNLANGCYEYMFNGCSSLTTAPTLSATNLANGCYNSMFKGCSSLTTAPTLSATELVKYCYAGMFSDCSSLTTAPALPAETLAEGCYEQMFNNCSSLTTAPVLSATELAEFCYSFMFSGCSSLKTAPALPATTLTNGCYQLMFNNCNSLTTAPVLSAEVLAEECYFGMFGGCSGLSSVTCLATDISAAGCTRNWLDRVASGGTFTKAASMTEDAWRATGIPSGWEVQNYYVE